MNGSGTRCGLACSTHYRAHLPRIFCEFFIQRCTEYISTAERLWHIVGTTVGVVFLAIAPLLLKCVCDLRMHTSKRAPAVGLHLFWVNFLIG